MRICVFLLLACSLAPAQSPSFAPAGKVVINSYNFGGKPVPHWSGGAIVAYEGNAGDMSGALVHVFDTDGREVTTVSVAVPGAGTTTVSSTARSADGTLAVSGAIRNAGGGWAGSYIALYSSAGQLLHLIRTEPYEPRVVAFAPDGTLWTKGHEILPNFSATDAGLIRHFDRSGKQLGGFIPQSSVSQAEFNSAPGWVFAVSKDRAGWYLGPTYREVAFDGTVQEFPGMPLDAAAHEGIHALAILDSGDVYVTKVSHRPKEVEELYVLDRSRRVWNLVPAPVAHPYLAGAAGDILVFGTARQFPMFTVKPSTPGL